MTPAQASKKECRIIGEVIIGKRYSAAAGEEVTDVAFRCCDPLTCNHWVWENRWQTYGHCGLTK